MKKFFMISIVTGLSLFLSGCLATTQKYKASADSLSNQVHVLENDMRKKDREISRLKGLITELSAELEEKKQKLVKLTPPTKTPTKTTEHLGIIRVNASIEEVQAALKNAGYYEGKVDGKLGPNTINAIAAFQRSNNLLSDSIVGAQTWEKLKTNL